MATAYQVGDRVPCTGQYAPHGDPVTDSAVLSGGDGSTHHHSRTSPSAEPHRRLIEGSIFPDVPELGPNVRWFRIA